MFTPPPAKLNARYNEAKSQFGLDERGPEEPKFSKIAMDINFTETIIHVVKYNQTKYEIF